MKLQLVLLMIASFVVAGCTSTPGDDSSGNPLVTDRNHSMDWPAVHGVPAAIEVDSCKVCHGADYLGGTVNVSCMTCHISGPPFTIHTASWTNTVIDHQTFATLASWTTCANGNCHGSDLHGGSVGGASTGPSCFTVTGCHGTGPGDPASHSSAPYTDPANHGPDTNNNQIYCLNCHGRPANTFDGGFVADPAILNNSNGNCSAVGCHPDATAHPTDWQGSNDSNGNGYSASHRNGGVSQAAMNESCALCHKVDGAGVGPMPLAPSCYSPTNTNSNGSTTSCHSSGPSASHAVTDFAWTATTQTTCGTALCHDSAGNPDVIWDVHNGDYATAFSNVCQNCHNTSAGGAGTIKVGANLQGSALLAGNDKTVSCLVCHGAGYMTTSTTSTWAVGANTNTTYGGAHHLASEATGGTCTWCHADPRPGYTPSATLPSPIPTKLACIDCHDSGGNGVTITENWFSDSVTNSGLFDAGTTLTTITKLWNTVGSLTLNGKQPAVRTRTIHQISHTSPTIIDNWGICLSCHVPGGKGQAVQIWHARLNWAGYAGKATEGTLDVAGGTGSCNSDGGSPGNANEAYNMHFDTLREHPGRNTFGLHRGNGSCNTINGFPSYSRDEKYFENGGTNAENRGKNAIESRGVTWNDGLVGFTTVTIPCEATINDAEGVCNGTSDPVPKH